jgi:putative CocE/NonD family hydrolase
MSLLSRLIGWTAKLTPADTYDVATELNIQVPMPDGTMLFADHYYPRHSKGKPPTILVRSPYGRSGKLVVFFARPFAERGFQVLIQSCRGTFGSGGEFDALRNEHVDGLATLAWLREQPWFSGEMATVGPSYLGFVQWAIAAEAGQGLKAMAPQVTASEFRSLVYAGESFSLDTALTWIRELSLQEKAPLAALVASMRTAGTFRSAFTHLPLGEVDEIATGKPVQYFRQWLEHNAPGDEWWKLVDWSNTVASVTAPVHLIGGWYDIFLPYTITDYIQLQQAGRQPYLTIGPWNHQHPDLLMTSLRESIIWCRAHMLADRSRLREAPVRVWIMGANKWQDYAAWPPAGYTTQRWHLHSGKHLGRALPVDSAPDSYRYDPADPTPAVGGASLSRNSGPKDNRRLEVRPDVLVYSSDPLECDVEVVGPVRAELYARSTLEHTDFFVRLCDVDPSGRSINVCDGLSRLWPGRVVSMADGSLKIDIDLWPTAHRFLRGHRIRVQVSSGAHPCYARNPGSGEPLATATALVTAEQLIYHDPEHPSAILLPAMADA